MSPCWHSAVILLESFTTLAKAESVSTVADGSGFDSALSFPLCVEAVAFCVEFDILDAASSGARVVIGAR